MHNKKIKSKNMNKLTSDELNKIAGGSAIPESIGDAQPEGTSAYDVCIYEHSKHGLPIRGKPVYGDDDIERNGLTIPMKGGCDGLQTINTIF